MRKRLIVLFILLSSPFSCFGQIFNERFEDWPVDLKINGKILVAGKTEDGPLIARLLTEKERSLPAAFLLDPEVPAASLTRLLPVFSSKENLVRVEEKWSAEILEDFLKDRQLVILGGSKVLSQEDKENFIAAKDSFFNFIQRGGVLVLLGPLSEIASTSSLSLSKKEPPFAAGLNLIPDTVLATNYNDDEDREQLLGALLQHPRSVGIGLPDKMVLMLSGRKIRVAGSGGATFLVAGNENQEPREQVLTEYKGRTKKS